MPNPLKSKSAAAAIRKTSSTSPSSPRTKRLADTSSAQATASKVLFKFLARDTETGVTLATADKLQEALQLGSRTEVIHLALAKLAKTTLPHYNADDGPVSNTVLAEIRRRVPQGKLKSAKSLF